MTPMVAEPPLVGSSTQPTPLMLPRTFLFILIPLLLCGGSRGQSRPSYEYSGSELVRIVQQQRQAIGCTDTEGTGIIRGVARSPLGTTYVIADRGLFSLSDDVSHLTPLVLKAGAPSSLAHGIQVDERGVIWLATETGFGSIEPVHLFGRILTGGSFTGLSKAADGSMRAQSADGGLSYSSGAEAAPVVQVESADTAPKDGIMRVQLSSVTRGPALYAYRISRRHRYKTQSESEFLIEGLDPGRQELMFAVFDQDMQRSAEVRVVVKVPYPKQFSKAVAIPGILAVAIVLLLALLIHARRQGGGRIQYAKALLSAFVASVIGLQIIAGIIPHARGWPFVGFSMYSGSFAPGSYTYKAVLHGVAKNGGLRRILPASAGYMSDGAWQALLPMVYGKDAERQRFMDAYNKRHPKTPIKGIVISDQKHRLTAQGPIAVAPVVMCVYPEGILDAQ